MPKAIKFMVEYLKKEDKRIYLRAVTKEVVEHLSEEYPGKFNYIEERDYFDYVYDGESLRTLAGRKNQKKRNHLNYFLKEYDFCDDCYKAFGKMMKMCSNTQGVSNPLFKLILSFKDELEKGNDNVD